MDAFREFDVQGFLRSLSDNNVAPVAKTVAVETQPGQASSSCSNSSKPDSLENEFLLLQQKYQACLRVKESKEYKNFSITTLRAEAAALKRLEQSMQEVQQQLRHVATPLPKRVTSET